MAISLKIKGWLTYKILEMLEEIFSIIVNKTLNLSIDKKHFNLLSKYLDQELPEV